MRTTRRAAALLTVFLVTSNAHAQEEPSAADTSSARALGQEGVRLADAGNCAEAVDKLAKAERIFHAPTLLDRLGEGQVQLGKLVAGTEHLNPAARPKPGPSSPAAAAPARGRA